MLQYACAFGSTLRSGTPVSNPSDSSRSRYCSPVTPDTRCSCASQYSLTISRQCSSACPAPFRIEYSAPSASSFRMSIRSATSSSRHVGTSIPSDSSSASSRCDAPGLPMFRSIRAVFRRSSVPTIAIGQTSTFPSSLRSATFRRRISSV